MGRVADRLAELGIELPAVVTPVASYTPAVLDGDHVWVSGQVPMVQGSLARTGKLGDGEGFVTVEEGYELARICALNGIAAAHSVLGDLDRVVRVVKVLGMVNSDPQFTGQPQVINGASDVLGQVFGEAGVHARSAFGVAALPLGAPVEVEMVLAVR
ncbi:RidA family protein [Spongisporangium articulatum]|uniref:RidA family protein n=1 Tax=Spongisporangium articulatum TaxID=3362603 RepID=A0ABW8AIT9_9ACTN